MTAENPGPGPGAEAGIVWDTGMRMSDEDVAEFGERLAAAMKRPYHQVFLTPRPGRIEKLHDAVTGLFADPYEAELHVNCTHDPCTYKQLRMKAEELLGI